MPSSMAPSARKIRHNFPQAIVVDGSTAIAHVCYNFNVLFVVVRAILTWPISSLISASTNSRVVAANSPP